MFRPPQLWDGFSGRREGEELRSPISCWIKTFLPKGYPALWYRRGGWPTKTQERETGGEGRIGWTEKGEGGRRVVVEGEVNGVRWDCG